MHANRWKLLNITKNKKTKHKKKQQQNPHQKQKQNQNLSPKQEVKIQSVHVFDQLLNYLMNKDKLSETQ